MTRPTDNFYLPILKLLLNCSALPQALHGAQADADGFDGYESDVQRPGRSLIAE
jgi:hypothetical protein